MNTTETFLKLYGKQLEEKKARLGNLYVFHPGYKPNKIHSSRKCVALIPVLAKAVREGRL